MSHLNAIKFDFHAFFLAAHCIKSRHPEDVTAIIGRLNISDDTEKEWTRKNILSFKSHKDSGMNGYADSDIAVLILGEEVTFTKFIQPICLPTNNQNNFSEGTIVGYGKVNELSNYQEVPLHSVLQTVNLNKCNSSHDDACDVLALNSFCAKNDHHYSYACEGKKSSLRNFQ